MSDYKHNWDYHAKDNPYYIVATHDHYRGNKINSDSRLEFFQTGEDLIQNVWDEVRSRLVPNFSPNSAVDFGCGVGRLVVPLAKRCREVVGIDISPRMLDEARVNISEAGLRNVTVTLTDEFFRERHSKVDYIQSFIALQHVPPMAGEKIVRDLIGLLNDGGVGALHFTYTNSEAGSAFRRYKFYRDYPIINWLKNTALLRKSEPVLPIFEYDINRVLQILQDLGCHQCFVRFTSHGLNGVVFFFTKVREGSW